MMAKQRGAADGRGEIVLYRTPGGRVSLDIRLSADTLWLSLNQLSSLFDRDKSVISRHLRNIYREKELTRRSTVAYFATVQNEGGHAVERRIEYFNLDAVLSVGYRVNSKRGTQFRIWATSVLRDHLLRGYTVCRRRLQELQQTVKLISETASRKTLSGDEAGAVLRMVADYSYALELIDDFDRQRVTARDVTRKPVAAIEYDEAASLIGRLRLKYGSTGLFGREKDGGLPSSLGAVMQTFGGRELYPSLEEKAAHLLFFLVKNRPFVDGNKRIGAALFLWFLEKNGALYRADGTKRIADNALVALTLLVALSRPAEKEIVTALTVNLINKKNR